MRIILGMTLMALVLAPAVSQSQPHIIDTIAGNGTPGSSGDGGPAVNAVLSTPRDVAVDAQGNVYVSSGPRVRKINAVTGIITTVAGNGDFFYNGDGIPATSAAIGGASGIALDAAGNLYIAQATLNRVRRVDALTGIITTVAGTGVEGFSGDGGPATSATFFGPFDVAVGPNGDLCISDTNNRRIRRVNGATGVITTIGGNGGYGPSGDGVPATAVTITHPWEVAFDAAGNCHFAEFAAHRIRRIDQQSGLLWTAAGTGAFGYNGDGIAATAAQLNTPRGIFFDAANNLLVADTNNGRIRRVDRATGLISTIAGSGEGFSGDGGPALNAQLVETYGFTQDAHGNLYLTDSFTHRIRRVANAVPSVDAGPDASYAVGQPIALDGSASFDADGDSLTYRWREAGVVVGEGPDVTLERPAGTYVFELTVTDSWTGRSSDSVTVTVLAPTPTPTPTLTPTSTPTPTPTPTPTATSTPTPTRTPTPTPTSGPTYVEARVHAVRSNVHHSHPEKTIDDRLSTYWTGHGDGVWLKYDLGQTRTVGFVKIAFLKGDERRYRFDIQVSHDAHTWSTVRAGVQSSGTTREEEAYDFPDVAARYVRYVGHGSTAGRKNSVTEVSLMVRR